MQSVKKIRRFEIDLDKTANFVVLGLKNITDRVQNFSFAHHRFSLSPRQIKMFRVDKVYTNMVRNMVRGTFLVKEYEAVKSIYVKNISTQRMSCILEDARPILMVPGEELIIDKVRFIDFYKEQPGLLVKVHVEPEVEEVKEEPEKALQKVVEPEVEEVVEEVEEIESDGEIEGSDKESDNNEEVSEVEEVVEGEKPKVKATKKNTKVKVKKAKK